MMITPRQIIVAVLAGAAGAALGGSHLLCPSGQCPLTGSWYGTGAIGAFIGFIYAESLPMGRTQTPTTGDSESDDGTVDQDEDESGFSPGR